MTVPLPGDDPSRLDELRMRADRRQRRMIVLYFPLVVVVVFAIVGIFSIGRPHHHRSTSQVLISVSGFVIVTVGFIALLLHRQRQADPNLVAGLGRADRRMMIADIRSETPSTDATLRAAEIAHAQRVVQASRRMPALALTVGVLLALVLITSPNVRTATTAVIALAVVVALGGFVRSLANHARSFLKKIED